MTLTIEKLATDTIFTFQSREWQKNAMGWGSPQFVRQGVLEENLGKPHTLCTPKYGEQFQKELAIYLPDETVVFIK